jgi:hypothetical protein
MARYRELKDARGIAMAQILAGWAKVMLGDIAGEALLGQALEGARSLGARKLAITALRCLADARELAGNLPDARQRCSEALEAARAVGAERLAAVISLSLAEREFQGGDAAKALQLVDEASPVLWSFSDARCLAHGECNKAAYLVALRRFDDARIAAGEALSAARDIEWSVGLVWALQHLAAIGALRLHNDAQASEDLRRAARILGYANAHFASLESRREYTERQEYEAMIPALRDALGADRLAQLMAEGSIWSEDRAVSEAMLI